MGVTYILVFWTVVGVGGKGGDPPIIKHDWRPIGEFHAAYDKPSVKPALEMCQDAARQLGLKIENYRCVRSK